MNILRQELAPITQEGWNEINEQAKEIFTNNLTARKFADVVGPNGWSFGGFSLGHLDIPTGQKKGDVHYGINTYQPLTESRISFKLNIWELDNAIRGAKDVDLEPLEKAAAKIAKFEEDAIYKGFEKGCVSGLVNSSDHKKMQYPADSNKIIEKLAEAVGILKNNSIEGPYHLITGIDKWKKTFASTKGYPLNKQIEDLLGGNIILNPNINEAYLVSARGGDFELTIGQDLSIGYESHTDKEVQLYFTESFTFQVLEPKAVIVFE